MPENQDGTVHCEHSSRTQYIGTQTRQQCHRILFYTVEAEAVTHAVQGLAGAAELPVSLGMIL